MYFSCFTLCRKSYWISGSGIAPTHSSAMAHFVVAPMAIDVKHHHHHPQHSGHHNLPATSISPSPTILSHTQVRAGKELLPRVASTGDGGPDEEAGAKRKIRRDEVRAGKEMLPRVASTGDGGPDEEAGAKRKIRRDEVRAGKEMLPRVASTGDGGPDEEAGAKRKIRRDEVSGIHSDAGGQGVATPGG
ncbi:hypothetical protein M8J75_011031 [Diaphorina citri]|nr:hypothetical protein M8J75_011031 [Diaphorina citri]